MAQFGRWPNRSIELSEFHRQTKAAFSAITGGGGVLTGAGLKLLTAAGSENARSAYSQNLLKMDMNADGEVWEAEVRSAIMATPCKVM